MLYLTSISRHTGKGSTLCKLGVVFWSRGRAAPGSTAATFRNNAGEWQKRGLLKCWLFYSCVLAHYLDFMVGFSLYTGNKVIIFSPFIVVHKCITVGVVYE